jgi:hypothetical protein
VSGSPCADEAPSSKETPAGEGNSHATTQEPGRAFARRGHDHAPGAHAAHGRARTIDHGLRARRAVGEGEGGLRGHRRVGRAHDARRAAVLPAGRHRCLHGGQPRRSALERRQYDRRDQPRVAGVDQLHAGRRQRGRAPQLGHDHHRAGRQHGAALRAQRPAGAVPGAERAVSAVRAGGAAAGHRLARRVPVGAHRPRPLGRRLSTATDATAEAEGRNGSSWNRDVFCLSAGPNRQYETYFGGCLGTTQFGTCRAGDDFTYVIQGGTR